MPPNKVDLDTGVRVAVVPSQSSYFAGEQFTVTITLTNTNTRSPNETKKRTLSSTHKRGAHSISSVPLARPPTSPVTPRTPVPTIEISQSRQRKSKGRKGLIGIGRNNAAETPTSEMTSKKIPPTRTHSHSVVIPSKDLNGILDSSPSASKISPTATRSDSLPSNHPHARKQSVMDGSIQLHEMTPSTSSYFSPSASASTSAFSLSLDPISETAASAFPPTPSISSPRLETALYPPTQDKYDKYLYPTRLDPQSAVTTPTSLTPGRQTRLSDLGHGPPPNSQAMPTPRTAFSSTFPQENTELILYSYAQLVGTLTIMAPPVTNQSSAQSQKLNSLRHALLRRPVMGGGSMDISSSLHPNSRPGYTRRSSSSYTSRSLRTRSSSMSISSSILSYLTPSPPVSSQLWSPGHKSRSPSLISSFLPSSLSTPSSPITPNSALGSPVGLGIGSLNLSVAEDEIDPETPLPVFEVQPTMVAVDLTLGPGESRTYTYTLALPENLPPTFRGRALKFSYQLHVGVCRSGPGQDGGGGSNNSRSSTSRVMKVPIRIYNNVVESGYIRPYDFLWPLTRQKQDLQGQIAEDFSRLGVMGKRQVSAATSQSQSAPSQQQQGSLEGLRDYAGRLLKTFPDLSATGVRIKLPIEAVSSAKDRDGESTGEVTGCREAVEILTRNPRKVSYDVNKDGIKVAVLTFVKSAYRLGETVLGVLELNERSNRARVLKLSASLEAHESLPASLQSSSASRHLRKVHAEHHASLISACLRTTFSLDIPSDATPAFQCEVGEETHQPFGSTAGLGGLEWKVRICLLVAVASENAREGVDGARVRHLVRDSPPGDWGSSWRATNDVAPLEFPEPPKVSANGTPLGSPPTTTNTSGSQSGKGGWAAYFVSLLSPGEPEYHDGDEESDYEVEPNGNGVAHDDSFDGGFYGDEEDWREVKIETVECEIPIKVWPGNTAFRSTEVVFDV